MTQLDTLPAEPPKKIPTGWLAVIADPKVTGAAVYAFGAFFAAKNMGADLPPAEKLQLYQTALMSMGVVVTAVIAALGYQTGKLYEGTVPKGFASSAGEPATMISGSSIETVNSSQGNPAPASPARSGGAAAAGGRSVSTILLMLISIAFAFSGCATSESFKRAIPTGVQLASMEEKEYATADQSIGEDVRAERIRQADELAQTVAIPKAIDVDVIAREWADVEPDYRAYIEADPLLSLPSDRALRLSTPDSIDKLIDVEKRRRFNVFGVFDRSKN